VATLSPNKVASPSPAYRRWQVGGDDVHGGSPTALVGAVHDAVLHQSEQVQQLHRRGQPL
jgi:hypothetical protein